MTESSSFIETSVLVGYCILLDPHHSKCKSYINEDDRELYTSEGVREEYENTRDSVSSRLSTAVFDHIRDLKSDAPQGYLGPMDVNNVKKNVLSRGNDAFQFLYRYYSNVVDQGIPKEELEQNLRGIGRDIDRLVASREEKLDQMIEIWERQEEHPEVQNALSMIHEPDRMWVIEAHDLASNNDGHTEFATTNPTDFVYEGRKNIVLENTALDDVMDLSI